jgi:hypothetical protein
MADLVRVAATDPAGNADISHPIATPPNITYTVEASSSEWAGGQLYRISGFVRDVLTGTVAPLGPINGNLTDPNWPTRNREIVFPLPAAIAGIAAVNGIVEILAVVQIGAATAGRDTDLETSMFVWV